MRRPSVRSLAALALVTAAPLVAGGRDVPAATPAGPAIDCISTLGMHSMVRSDRVIDFVTGRRTYRNTLPNACPALGFEQRFAYEVHTPRLCSTDIITVLQGPGIDRGASCGLGRFEPVTLARPAR